MAHVRTALSLERELFEQAEEAARELKLTRSSVWSLAMAEFLHRRHSRAMLEEINAMVGDGPDEEDRIRMRGMRRLQRRVLADDPW
jgi:hypothetical protein